jgi:hypothetical protein
MGNHQELSDLVMSEVYKAGHSPDKRASLIEVQARMLGISTAIMSYDDDRVTNELLEGASQYMMEQAASVKLISRRLER